MRHPLVMGNWKLNGSKHQTTELIQQLRHQVSTIFGCNIVIAPPTMYLDIAKHAVGGSHIKIGAQNTDIEVSGAFTGDTSAKMLKDIGADYVILGHSERRTYHKESNQLIAKKFVVSQEAGLIPVLCIGETEAQNMAGQTEQVCAEQLDAVIALAGIAALEHSVIAYEPIWAIGTGKSATPEQAQQVHHFIRQHLAKQDATVAEKITILYGGSVNDQNADALFQQPDIDGALVGGASLKADAFARIITAAAK